MFCSVKFSACLEISVPGLGIEAMDFAAASKNMPNAFSAWSMVFSARSRSSAGTSSFGSIMVALQSREDVTIFPEPVCGRLTPALRAGSNGLAGIEAAAGRGSTARNVGGDVKCQDDRRHADEPENLIHRKHRSPHLSPTPPPRPHQFPRWTAI